VWELQKALLARAAVETGVRGVRASVRPDNIASSNLIRQYGFVQVGEQRDDEDGLELIYEMRPHDAAQHGALTMAIALT
jgi:[ribosomal protein S5]-alanine N-acetyltransferase